MFGQPSDGLDRSRLQLELNDTFAGPGLDRGRWIDHYLPQWTTPDRSKARYDFDEHGLRLRIDADQPAWRPDDGAFRVSNIQTGVFAGPYGSTVGTHRHVPDLRVRTALPTQRLWIPSSGMVEATLRASPEPTCMLAIWLVGLEETSPEDSGEICIAELFGNAIEPELSTVRLGIKAHHDPRLKTAMVDLPLPIDASDEHTYGAEWDADRVRFYVDGRLAHTVEQGLDYPLQVMVDLFEFPPGQERDASRYPKSAHVRAVRGYQNR